MVKQDQSWMTMDICPSQAQSSEIPYLVLHGVAHLIQERCVETERHLKGLWKCFAKGSFTIKAIIGQNSGQFRATGGSTGIQWRVQTRQKGHLVLLNMIQWTNVANLSCVWHLQSKTINIPSEQPESNWLHQENDLQVLKSIYE